MIHTDIKRFEIDGMVGESYLHSCRDNFERWLLTDMRDKGYIPHLDLSSVVTIQWVKETTYQFHISMYGVYVGDKSNNFEGMSDGRLIHRGSNSGSAK